MTVLFSDNFNRANNTTTLGAPWVEKANAQWGILNNVAYDVGVTTQMDTVVTSVGVTDYVVSMDAMYYMEDIEPECEPYFVVRYMDANNYIYVNYSTINVNPRNIKIDFKKVDGGTTTTMQSFLLSSPPYTTTKYYNYKVVANGNLLEAYISGELQASYTLTGADATKFGSAGTSVGFGLARTGFPGTYNSANTSPAYLDNFLATTIPPPPINVSTPYATKQSSTADRSSAVAMSQVLTADRSLLVAMNQVVTADRVVDYATQQTLYPPFVDQSYAYATKQIVYANRITGALFDITMASSAPAITNIKTTTADFKTGTMKSTSVLNDEVKLAPEMKRATAVVVPLYQAQASSFTADINTYLAYSITGASFVYVKADGTLSMPSGSYTGYANVRGIDVDNGRNELWIGYIDGTAKSLSFTPKSPYSTPVQVKTFSCGFEVNALAYDPDLDMVWLGKRETSTTSYHLYTRDGVLVKANALTNVSGIAPHTIRIQGGDFVHLDGGDKTSRISRYKKNADYTLNAGTATSTTIQTYGNTTLTLNATPTLVNDAFFNFYKYGSASPYTWEQEYHNIGVYMEEPAVAFAGTTNAVYGMYGYGTTMWEMAYDTSQAAANARRIRAFSSFGFPTNATITIVDSSINLTKFIYDGTDFYVHDSGANKVYKNGVLANVWTTPAEVPTGITDMGYDGTNLVFLKADKLYKVSKTGVYAGQVTLPFQALRMSLNNNQTMWLTPTPWNGNMYKLDYNTLDTLLTLPSTGDYKTPSSVAELSGKLVVTSSANKYFHLYVADGSKVVPRGTYTASPVDVSMAKSATNSSISWTQTLNGGTIAVQTSLDNGTSWQTAVSGGSIANASGDLTGKNVLVKADFATPDVTLTPKLLDITVSVTDAAVPVNVSRTYSMTQAMYVDYSNIYAVSQAMTADRSFTAFLAQTITADRSTLESIKQVLTADRVTLESMKQMLMVSIDVSTLYAMKQAMYVGYSSAGATKQVVRADRSSAYASWQSLYSTPTTAYPSTQKWYVDYTVTHATQQKWYVGHTVTSASQQFIYANQTLPAPLSQIIHADRTTNYPTSQMSHTTRTGEHALTQSYYFGASSTHLLAQTLYALRLDNFTLNQFIPMDRVWAHPLMVKIVDPMDKRITVVNLVAILEEMDVAFIVTKDAGDVALFAQKDTDVNMAIRMAVREALLS